MSFERIPEPTVMVDNDSVSAFHDAGAAAGPLSPIYHFNATHLSRLVPAGGTLLDMGCGSGQFLRYFLTGRPDVRAIGLDLSAPMLQLAGVNLQQFRFSNRVNFVQGPFAEADLLVHEQIDAVACLSALHHCPSIDDLTDTLRAIYRIHQRDECAVWLFDVVRPESLSLTELIPRTYEVSSRSTLPAAFRLDWVLSLQAGWTAEEFALAIDSAGLQLQSHSANYSQLHWSGTVQANADGLWQGPPPCDQDLSRARAMSNSLLKEVKTP